MPSAENDVAALLRMKAARDKAAEAAYRAQAMAATSRHQHLTQLQRAARTSWPGHVALLRRLLIDYQARSRELGIRTDVEEVFRLRAGAPIAIVDFAGHHCALSTRVFFRMMMDGRTYCRIRQTGGRWRSNLNREERAMKISEHNVRPLFRTIVQILILEG